jgi:hypothetical protein
MKYFALLLLALTMACINPFAPAPIASDTWVEIAPLSGYAAEFDRMRRCTSVWADTAYTDSLAGDVPRWYMVQRGDVRTNGRRAAAAIGRYVISTDSLGRDSLGTFIAIAEDYLRDKDIVRHELIHALQVKHPGARGQRQLASLGRVRDV